MRTLAEAAKTLDARRPRSRQRVMGASDIGPCIRRGGYVYHRTPATDPDEGSMSAILGTWIHEGGLHALEAVYGSVIETLVEHPTKAIRGHVDAIDYAEAHIALIRHPELRPGANPVTTVEDLKTRADERMIDTVRLMGPPAKELRQAYTYVWLLQEYGPQVDPRRPKRAQQRALRALGPVKVDRVRLRYLARDRGEEYVWEDDVDPDMVAEARERFIYVTRSKAPEDLPREQDGPGLSYVCDSCPFVTACWGSKAPTEDGVWPQAVRLREGSTTEAEEIARYLEGKRLARQADDLKNLARATLTENAPTGIVAEGVGTVKWTGNKPKPPVPDVDAMQRILVEAGAEIPMKDGGRTALTINVSPAK